MNVVQNIQLYIEADTREQLLAMQIQNNLRGGMTFKYSHMMWDDQKKVWFQNYVGDGTFLLKRANADAFAKGIEDGGRPILSKKANRRP